MAITPKQKDMLNEELANPNADLKVLAKKYGVGRSTLYNMRQKLQKHGEKADIQELVHTPTVALETIRQEIAESDKPKTLKKQISKTLDSIESLQLLETDLHDTLRLGLEKANILLNQDRLSIIDWQIVMTTVALVNKEVFNTKSPTVNNLVQGDLVGGSKTSLGSFQMKMRG